MKICIYYGGRGLIEDSTLYVLNKMQQVFEELRVTVERYNIFEYKNTISTLPQTFKDADGIILASNLEWFGIGGYMQQFLDSCWLYGDKDRIKQIYMMPVVISKAYGEREAEVSLMNAWEILGGLVCKGMCTYVDDNVEFEMDQGYASIIEEYAENLYKIVSRHPRTLPVSNIALKKDAVAIPIELTPQESEQLSKYVSDDTYVRQQKEDIEELSSLFRSMLKEDSDNIPAKEDNVQALDDSNSEAAAEVTKPAVATAMLEPEEKRGNNAYKDIKKMSSKKYIMSYVEDLNASFADNVDFEATYSITIVDKLRTIIIEKNAQEQKCYFGERTDVDVAIRLNDSIMDEIVKGRMSFQKAFMTGEMTAKGNFKTLRMLDTIFNLQE